MVLPKHSGGLNGSVQLQKNSLFGWLTHAPPLWHGFGWHGSGSSAESERYIYHHFIFQNIIKTSRIAFMLLLTFFKKCERNRKISGSFLEFLWFLRFFLILFDIFRIYKIHETFLGFKGLLSDFSEKWTRFFWGIYPSSWKLVLMYFYRKDVEITFCKIINQNRGGERNYWLCWRQKNKYLLFTLAFHCEC